MMAAVQDPKFEPNLPPPAGLGGTNGTGGGATRWTLRGPKPQTPAAPPPPSDFDRLADAITTLYGSQGGGVAAPPTVVSAPSTGGGGNAGVGKVLVLGVLAALIAWGIIRQMGGVSHA